MAVSIKISILRIGFVCRKEHNCSMNKVIVYGLGKAFDSLKEYIEIRYEIVGFCDKNPNAAIGKCINKYIYISGKIE